jgi:hypothetical protein
MLLDRKARNLDKKENGKLYMSVNLMSHHGNVVLVVWTKCLLYHMEIIKLVYFNYKAIIIKIGFLFQKLMRQGKFMILQKFQSKNY